MDCLFQSVLLSKQDYMKKAFTTCIAAILSLSVFSQTWIRPQEPAKHKGDTVNLIGFVTNVKQAAGRKGSPTLITLSGKDSIPSLTLVVWSADRSKFKESLRTAYLDQYVQVKGKVEIYKGDPQIILHSEKQISIARDAAPEQE